MARQPMWTTDRAMVELRRHVVRAGSQKALAAEIGVSPAYLSDVLAGARAPNAIFERIGLQRIVRWKVARHAARK